MGLVEVHKENFDKDPATKTTDKANETTQTAEAIIEG